MNNKQKKKLIGTISVILLLGIALGLMLYALKQNINLFYTPSELLQTQPKPEQIVRLGGYVKPHSVRYDSSGQHVDFLVTDRAREVTVTFNGMLPALFKEGQVVVVTGKLTGAHVLTATQVLAKHDEKYMPKPLAKKLKSAPA
jgi:cytochrome c-type biogenesis protein CcmE